MTIRSRLLASFGVVAGLLMLPMAYGLQQLRAVRGIAVALRTEHAEAYAALGTLREGLVEFDRHARSYVIAPDPVFRSGLGQALARAGEATGRLASVGYTQEAEPLGADLDSLGARTRALDLLVAAGRAEEATAFLRQAVQPLLKPGQTTVGTRIDVAHLAATPEGMTATITVELTAVDRRRLTFHVEVRDEVEKVGEGTHERFIIDRDQRMPRLQAKLDAWHKG